MPTTTETITLDPALNMARQSLYRFAALTLLDPKLDSWRQLVSLREGAMLREAAAVIRELPEAVPTMLALGERPLCDLNPAAVFSWLPDSPQQFNQDYEDTFGLLVSNACPPYETEYINSKFTFQRSNSLADIAGYYNAFGLATSVTHPERPDHIVQELEFMAFLIGMERRAGESESPLRGERQAICRDAQKRFLHEHLAWWTPAFARLLSIENPRGFLTSSGEFLSALIAAERGILGVEAPTQTAGPSPIERPEACDGCELHSS